MSKLNEFADDNFKFDENGRKFLKQVENNVGKGEIAHYEWEKEKLLITSNFSFSHSVFKSPVLQKPGLVLERVNFIICLFFISAPPKLYAVLIQCTFVIILNRSSACTFFLLEEILDPLSLISFVFFLTFC